MKKHLFLYLALSLQLMNISIAGAVDGQTLVTGSIQFPSSISKPPSLKILYQGYKYPVEVTHDGQRTIQKGHFEFYIDALCNELYIVVAENLQIPDKNNFDHLKTSSDSPYRLYKLTKRELPQVKDEPRKLTWLIEEVEHDSKKEAVLPDNTLIFFMSPSMIARLEEESWIADQHVIRLPRIIFNEMLTEQELQDIATRMSLALLDFELFHVQLPKRLMISENRIVAMPYLQRPAQA